jgi:inhibitor of KinA sporulation pathway (predicted exonuclease)
MDRFRQVIRPKVYKKLHFRTSEIVNLTETELRAGKPFPEAVRAFLEWAGADTIFCTWGSMDLTELQRNLKFYHMLGLLPGPFHYYDVQKLYTVQYEKTSIRRSLEYAIERLGIEKSRKFHSALSDAEYTADILKKIRDDYFHENDSIDIYQNPKKKTDEIFNIYEGHSLFISREFRTKEQVMQDPEVRSTHCCKCGKKARKKIRWFAVNLKKHYCVAVCPEHGDLECKVRICHNDEGRFYAKKTICPCDPAEVAAIRIKKDEMKEKRRKKRCQLTSIP